MSDTETLEELEAVIEAEIAQKVPQAVETIREMMAEAPDMTVGELASIFLVTLNESHLAWYAAFLFMEKAKEAQVG